MPRLISHFARLVCINRFKRAPHFHLYIYIVVVHQYYQSEVNNEYVIRGNAAILKCSIPSFVAEFVQVVGWQDDQGNSFNPDGKNGRMVWDDSS